MGQGGAIIHRARNKYKRRFYPNFILFHLTIKLLLILGRIRAHLADQGTPIGPYDSHIAAIALAHDLTLVTNNTHEYCRVANLKIEDWQTGL
jgi:tRNA(fMet)-specific endonuclease VapC